MVDDGCNILMQMSKRNVASFLFQLRRGQVHPLMLNLHFSVSCQYLELIVYAWQQHEYQICWYYRSHLV